MNHHGPWLVRFFDSNQTLVLEAGYNLLATAVEDAHAFLEAAPEEVKLSTVVAAKEYKFERRGYPSVVQALRV